MKRYDIIERSDGSGDLIMEIRESPNGQFIEYKDYESEKAAMCEADSNAVLGDVPDSEQLIKLAAELLTTIQLSDNHDDYKFRMPKYILQKIEIQSNRLREIAIQLKEISVRIK